MKFITRLGKIMKINDCTNNNIFQQWVYGVINRRLSDLVNKQVQETVKEGEVSDNTEVRSLPSEVPVPSYHTWQLEEIRSDNDAKVLNFHVATPLLSLGSVFNEADITVKLQGVVVSSEKVISIALINTTTAQ